MIEATFKRQATGQIVSFELSGHANSGPYGSDIVCAGVSALAFNTINSIDALAGFTPIVEVDAVDEGYLYLETYDDITDEQSAKSQLLLESLVLGLQGLQEEYSDFISLKTINN
ncbi:ribosomal-processing cysteine protease Prp [Vagococcus sp. PNs007]|uniref:Ribosomal processing cysteine protease Prp n=1 Tax=Vagococcus proximus TaxID=2991417 RepID=A0ABT5X0C5_9ENTE|nr:ribosomal-processing cysteine protease Prp [Vagococcus proximus]MDF0479406.1 ribosomal-processing cysteine protease Prp [Vagococcus proximus]